MRARTGSSQLVPAERRTQIGHGVVGVGGKGDGGLEAAACCARSSQVCVGTALVELVSSACQPRPRLPLPAAPALLLAGSLQSANAPCACVNIWRLASFRGFRLFLGAASLGCPGPLDLRVASPVEKMVRYFALAARGGQPRPRSRDSPAAPSTALHVPACSPERHPRRAAGLS